MQEGLHQLLPSSWWESLYLGIYIHTSTHREVLFRLARTVILNGSQWRTRSACEAALHFFHAWSKSEHQKHSHMLFWGLGFHSSSPSIFSASGKNIAASYPDCHHFCVLNPIIWWWMSWFFHSPLHQNNSTEGQKTSGSLFPAPPHKEANAGDELWFTVKKLMEIYI